MAAVLMVVTACAQAQAEVFSQPTASLTPTLVSQLATSTATLTLTPTPPPATPTLNSHCPLPPLLFGQHIAASGSYTETETQAAGPMVCRIERDSCAFGLMVGNLDPNIVFKREEEPPYHREDIRMHPAMLLPLYRLYQLVEAEWDGAYRLRVTDTYDSLLEHDLTQPDLSRRYSLHFEGRSADLTIWPIDQAQYGRLCTLAYCAGFDWVHYEGDHCHASIQADSLCHQCQD